MAVKKINKFLDRELRELTVAEFLEASEGYDIQNIESIPFKEAVEYQSKIVAAGSNMTFEELQGLPSSRLTEITEMFTIIQGGGQGN